jgi:hypothetical protein
MNHTIKGIIIVVAITSILVLGASMVPIMQNSFAHKKFDFKQADPDTNTNTNTNTADSTSSSDATASNTNNINNTATASNSQEQSACAVAVTCPEGSTSIDLVRCPHSPYTDFVAGNGCQNGEPVPVCIDLTGAATTVGPNFSGMCAGFFLNPSAENIATCTAAKGTFSTTFSMCTYPATQTCPPPQGSTQTPTVVNGRCTIQPGAT